MLNAPEPGHAMAEPLPDMSECHGWPPPWFTEHDDYTPCLAWGNETVQALVRGIVLEQAYDRMPILADALEEAGCDDELILRHCRECDNHNQNCWVLFDADEFIFRVGFRDFIFEPEPVLHITTELPSVAAMGQRGNKVLTWLRNIDVYWIPWVFLLWLCCVVVVLAVFYVFVSPAPSYW